MKKKILSLLLVAGLSVSLFAGCGSGAADADKATAEGGKEAARISIFLYRGIPSLFVTRINGSLFMICTSLFL